jgi:hypothetical protein
MKGKYGRISLIAVSMIFAISFMSFAFDIINDNAQERDGTLGLQNGIDIEAESGITISSAAENGSVVNITLANGSTEKDGDQEFELNMNLLVAVIIIIIIAIGGTASYTLRK